MKKILKILVALFAISAPTWCMQENQKPLLTVAQQLLKQQKFTSFVQTHVPGIDTQYYTYELKHYYAYASSRERFKNNYEKLPCLKNEQDNIDTIKKEYQEFFDSCPLFQKLLLIYKIHKKNDVRSKEFEQEMVKPINVLRAAVISMIISGMWMDLTWCEVFGCLYIFLEMSRLIMEKTHGELLVRHRKKINKFLDPALARGIALEEYLREELRKRNIHTSN